MKILEWIAGHRSLVATATSGTVVVALVAGLAIASTGYTAHKLDLGDGSVWVTNDTAQAVGRANPEVLELNSVVRAGGQTLEIVQNGDTVLVVDHANATVQVLDPASSTLGDAIALPPDDPQVFLAGSRVVIHSAGTGELWIVPLGELNTFDTTQPVSLSLGLKSVVNVGPDGILYAYSAEVGEVFRVDAAHTDVVDSRWKVDFGSTTEVQVSSVGSSWAVLDATGRRLALERGTVDLSNVMPVGTRAVLQKPAAAGNRVLVGTDTGLLAVPLASGDPVVLVDGQTGVPAAPLALGGCDYAAWASGEAWRRCAADGDGVSFALDGATGGALNFAVNIDRVVLNDVQRGTSWAIQDEAQRIDNWDALLVQEPDAQSPENDPNIPPTIDEVQKPPVAVDDQFGARPGRATVLPVLLNDYDPNADVLVIDQVDPIDESIGRLDLVTRNQQIQLTLQPGASGTVGFRYTISDGRGGIATASVVVTIRTDAENSPPRQVRATRSAVTAGGRVSTQVLSDWVDPDGDAFYLTSATTASPDQVSYKPDGVVVFADSGLGGELKSVTLTVTDGREEATGSLAIGVSPAGQLPILIEPWFAIATAGQEITVRPMSHVTGGNGPLRLNAVPARAGSTVTPSFEAGTFTFSSDEVRTHYVEFTVTDGDQTATGLVRIDVSAPPDANTRPITVPRTVFVTTLSSDLIDPTTTDIDPAGGVLVVTGVTNPASNRGVRAEVLDQRQIRVTLTAPLNGQPVTLNYRISNGLADAEGTITVVEIPDPAQLQPPIAVDDTATVRVGDVVDIPVLANDEQPEGKPIMLLPTLAEPLPEGAGLLFVAGDQLRYLAPEVAGNYVAAYSVAGPDGQHSEARVTISVREENPATNSAPVPRQVTARVLAGATIRIQIPLTGVDPDGDSVQLIGITSNPDKGIVLGSGPTYIEYEAGDYSSGTDQFTYAIVDTLGARAEGIVRVGISPRLDGARNPVANEDAVSVRPNRTVSVQALVNDSDPDGSPLRIISVDSRSTGTTATIVNDSVVDITPPSAPGSYSVIYTIQNEYGGTSQNFINVEVDPTAPLSYPLAEDSVLTASDVVDRTTVDVNVLDNVFFADGAVSALGVTLLPGFATTAQLLPNKSVRVTIGDKSQIIPFSVSHPDDDTIRSYAFIWVPGYDDALPQINRTAPLLTVASESTLTIDLNAYIVTLRGRGVRLTDSSTVRATHANGDSLVVDGDTLEFTSADQYFGPASITFEVTDGSSASDPNGRTAILTLPIDVKPRENQPPVFIGGVVDFEPGQEKELDLVKLTNYPYDDIDELAYTVLEPLPEGFTFELNGQRLVIRAAEDAPKGTTTDITLAVRDALNGGRAGRIKLQVVPSTLPLVKPVADVAITPRGTTTTIDVLANDEANNPFPETPLHVVDIRGLDGASLPDGVTVVPSADKSRLTVTVSDTALPADVRLQYEVADATQDADRYVWGSITISIQDVPDPVTGVTVTEFGDHVLKASWVPGQFNNSPISRYEVAMTSVATDTLLSVTSCTSSVNCALATPGNGPAYAVRLAVIAVNAIGPSSPTSLAGQIWSDVIPPPPSNLTWTPLDQGLRLTWAKPADTAGSPIDMYVVTVGDAVQSLSVGASDPIGTVYSANLTSASIANGSSVGFSVSARNSAPNSLATWNQATGAGVPAGAPTLSGTAVSASASLTDGSTANASWAGVFGGNGKPVSDYWAVIRSDSSVPNCTVTGVESGSPVVAPPSGAQHFTSEAATVTFTGLSANQTYTIWVFGYNGQGCTAATAVQVTPRAVPGTVTAIDTTGPSLNGTDDEFFDFRLNGFTIASGSTDADMFSYRFTDGTTDGSQSAVLSPAAFLTAGTSQYGHPVTVEVKACRAYPEGTLCSADWSADFALGVPVRNSTPGGLQFDGGILGSGDGWSWTSIPGPGYDAVAYRCDFGNDAAGWMPMPDVGSCDPGVVPLTLRVRISANEQTYQRSYDTGP
ncbi:MAG: Ig-like domain-containing protein [Pseudolysinimonas sp.]|uniref:Ig-like domain-containing protein n=1 Tax=Pseudolysinimonas sp. TaxID=2680009 RepID=UPI0032647186